MSQRSSAPTSSPTAPADDLGGGPTASGLARHPLICFSILTLAFSWVAIIPFALGVFPGPLLPCGPFLAAIVTAVDEPLETLRCKSKSTGCMPGGARCLTHDLWEALGDHIQSFLAGVSLEDVIEGRLGPSKAA